jgi:hypothetical protein
MRPEEGAFKFLLKWKELAMPERYSTSDLWLGVFFLCEINVQLVDIQVSCDNRETVFFTFMGENLSKLARTYFQNQALANVVKLRSKINELRDLIFSQRATA